MEQDRANISAGLHAISRSYSRQRLSVSIPSLCYSKGSSAQKKHVVTLKPVFIHLDFLVLDFRIVCCIHLSILSPVWLFA